MKKIITLSLVLISMVSLATNYQTIDNGGGNIGWSTDGGLTDCGCTPDYNNKQDSIFVHHAYTFNNNYLNGDELEAYFEINTSMDTVVFADSTRKVIEPWLITNSVVEFQQGVVTKLQTNKNFIISNSTITCQRSFKIDETTALISGSKVTFNATCEVFGKKNERAGNIFIDGLSEVYFNGNIYGDFSGDGKITFDESDSHFSSGSIIGQVRMDINALATLTINNGVTIDESEIYMADNSSVIMRNNITVVDSKLTANTPNLVVGQNAIFTAGTILDFREKVNGFFWGTISFDNVEILLKNGCLMAFLSGVTIENSRIDIENGAIAEFDSTNIDEVNLSISGLFKSKLSTVITNSEIAFSATGIMDLTQSTHCDFNRSKVGTSDATDVLICGETYNPDQNDYKFWENGAWSGDGNPPNNVGAAVEIRDDYSTAINGNFLCGNMLIENDVVVTIDSLGFIHTTQIFNNRGVIIVKNEGSLLMDDGISYWENNGSIRVESLGPISNMQYNIWSCPVRDTFGILSDFPNTNPCDIYAFDGGAQTWKYDYEENTDIYCGVPPNDTHLVTVSAADIIPGANGLMEKGRGYYIPGNNQSDLREFNGKVNTGRISMFIKTTNLGSNPNWDNDDWNLVGNPYPSALDLNAFWARNASAQNALTDGVYFWVESKVPPYDQFGSYLVWNYSGGTYEPTSQNRSEISVVPGGKGFWVLANDPLNNGLPAYDLIFNNSMRTSFAGVTNNSKYVSTRYSHFSEEHHKLWVNLTNDSNMFDQILIATHPFATDSIDLLFDAHKNYGGEPLGIAMVNNSEAFTIQGFAPRIEVDTSEIELVILASDLSNHYLVIDSSDYYLNEKRVFLLDKLKGTEQEMLLGQPLTLDIDSVGRYDQRFYLKVTNSHITSIENVTDPISGRAWVTEGTLFYDSFTHDIESIRIYDLLGTEIQVSHPFNRNSRLELPDLAPGIFIIQLEDILGRRMIQKVFVN